MTDRDTTTLPREVVELIESLMHHAYNDGVKQLKYRSSQTVEAEEALRTALAAEQPKQEPVRCNPAAMRTAASSPAVLFITELDSPDAEALRRDAEWLKTDAEMMRWLIDNHTAWSWNPSRYNTDVIGGFAAFSTGYLGFDLKTAIRKAMQDSALQEDKR